jgi:hypothetical protein
MFLPDDVTKNLVKFSSFSQILENFQNQDGGQAFFCEGLVANF